MRRYAYPLLVVFSLSSIQSVTAKDNVRVYKYAPSASQLARDLGVQLNHNTYSTTQTHRQRTRRIVFPVQESNTTPRQEEQRQTQSSGKVLAFPLYFPSGSAQVTKYAAPFIDSVASLMQMDPNLKFQIEGHTDSSGSAADNLKLSEQRAVAVKNYLVRQHSISESRLTTIGKGSQEPLSGVDPRDRSCKQTSTV